MVGMEPVPELVQRTLAPGLSLALLHLMPQVLPWWLSPLSTSAHLGAPVLLFVLGMTLPMPIYTSFQVTDELHHLLAPFLCPGHQDIGALILSRHPPAPHYPMNSSGCEWTSMACRVGVSPGWDGSSWLGPY